MPDSSADRDPLDRLAEEFVARYRAGQRPSLTEYAERHPELAEQIRDLFPALVEMEQLKPVTADHTGAFTPSVEPSDPTRIGEFRILRRVGHGGMGIVYEAMQESLGRHVALKLLPIDALADPKRLERFRREAKAAAKLHHTNIVPVFGTGESDGRHYYAMQFIAGHPLDAVIDEVRRLKEKSPPIGSRAVSEVAAALLTGTFARTVPPSSPDGQALTATVAPDTPALAASSPSEPSSPALSGSLSDGGRHYWATVARIGAQAADALVYAHAQGILHRDIKPANLLLDLRGTVWVTDFGLAKATDADDLTHAGDIVGTLRYMAPERFDGQGDHRADVYALGLTLYELLTLKPAFVAESRAKLVEQVLAASPPKPRSINPAIPRDLETIVLKAIARDPAMRYQSASEMADDLRRYQEDRPIRARRASSAEQAWRWCRRNKAVASLMAAVVLVSVIGATVASLIASEQQKTAAALRDTLDDRDKTGAELVKTLGEKEQFAGDLDAALKLSEGRRKDLEHNGDQLRRTLYASLINRAQSALNDGRITNAVELLREMTPKPSEPDLRGWEWHYLNNLLRPDHEFSLAEPGSFANPSMSMYSLSSDGTRVLLHHPDRDGSKFYTVRETLTGRTVGRIPKTGGIEFADPDDDRKTESVPGGGNASVLVSTVLSQDGRYVYVRVERSHPAKNPDDPPTYVVDAVRSRLWNVETGESLPGPPEQGEASNLVIGPDAAWAVWFDATQVPKERASPRGSLRFGPAEVACSRWDRAKDKVTRLPVFKMGEGYGYPMLSPDGGTVYWVANGQTVVGKGKSPVGTPQEVENPWFECWDVTGDESRRRFQLRLPRAASMSGLPYRGDNYVFSPSGAMLAYRISDGDIVVYRTSDGEVHARFPLNGVPNSLWGIGRFYVSDDGDRIVVRGENQIVVLEKWESGTTVRHIPFAELSALMPRGALGPEEDRLLADGKTFVHLDRQVTDGSSARVRVWDVSRDPNRFERREPLPPVQAVSVEHDGKFFRRLAAAGGSIFFEWPQTVPSTDEPANKGEFSGMAESFGGPFAVRDPDGKLLGTISIQGERYYRATAELLADGHRLLVHFNVLRTAPKSSGFGFSPTQRWGLYDLDRGGREIAGGTGLLSRVPVAPYFIESGFGFDGGVNGQAGLGSGAGGTGETVPVDVRVLILRHAATGDVFHRIEFPNRDVRFCEFDPTGKTYLVESVPRIEQPEVTETAPAPRPVYSAADLAVAGGAFAMNPSQRPRPLLGGEGFFVRAPVPVHQVRIHMFDAATHRELHAWDVPDQFRVRDSYTRFSPDGKRILLRYMGVEPDMKGLAWATPTSPDRLWVARPDGRVEHDILLTRTPLSRFGGPASWSFRGNTGLSGSGRGVVCSPDGKHAALPVNGELQIWDLDVGKLRHTLTGHGGRGVDVLALYNADGSRLFTVLSSNGPETTSPIHVWDTATGRELLTLATSGSDQRLVGSGLELVGEKLRLFGGAGVRMYDGTPVKP